MVILPVVVWGLEGVARTVQSEVSWAHSDADIGVCASGWT